ncbi:MAG: ankyrin repeat domain-containing protein [Candidatus Omnitrophica bacterium]|nr:ankyrin repeat domain-containing protein [Candidatus Omnitrophota bacterium]MBU1922826.1 ankyrin repeat domain-containing protein [Candidatus Omnitrophota bacterium]
MKLQSRRIMLFVLMGILFLGIHFVFAEIITLKSGGTVEGEIIEKTDKYVKIYLHGVKLKYFMDEIKDIDGQKTVSSDSNHFPPINESALFEAVKNVDILKVKQLISEGVDVNVVNYSGATPLVWAINGCHKDIVELLLSKGAKVNTVDSGGMTPLMWAAHRCNRDIIELLLSKGADVKMKDKNGKTAWIWSVVNRNKDAKDVVEFFLSKDVDVNAKDNSGGTVLMWAAGMENKEIVELLLSKGADVNARNSQGLTASMYAGKNGFNEIAELLRLKEEQVQPTKNSGKVDYYETQKTVKADVSYLPPSGWLEGRNAHNSPIVYSPDGKATILNLVRGPANIITFQNSLLLFRQKAKPISEEKITFLGNPCYVFTSEETNSRGGKVKTMTYMFLAKSKLYTLVYGAVPDYFDTDYPSFKDFLNTYCIMD